MAAPAPLRLRALLAVPAAIAVLLLAALLVDAGSDVPSTRASLRLSDIPQGASAAEAAGRAVLLARDGDEVIAFLPAIPDRAGHDVVVPCPAGGFMSEIRASYFDATGRKLGGPAPRDLDRYETLVRWNEVVVDTATIEIGAGIQQDRPVTLAAGPAWDRAYGQATIPGFCPPPAADH